MVLLSKSKYIIGISCPKKLWLAFHQPKALVEPAVKYIMEQGSFVGKEAQKLFPSGVALSENFGINLSETKQALLQRKILFEPGIKVGQLYARPDVLMPVEDDAWDIIEVKSSTRVKEEHYHDVSFQKYVYEKAGLKIRKCFLMHINKEYVRQGELDYNALFIQEDITDEVSNYAEATPTNVAHFLTLIESDVAPSCTCNDCLELPEHNVLELYRGRKHHELLAQNILQIKDIPDTFPLSAKQQIQKKCIHNNTVHIEKEGLGNFLATLKQPLYYLDFETFQRAIPLYDGTKPFQQIPFQYSLHIVSSSGVVHKEFLHQDVTDPRPAFLSSLKACLGNEGSIVAFNQQFEILRLKECADAFPEYKEWIDGLLPRFVDLLVPFRNFYYYHPEQRGSCSIKVLLPRFVTQEYTSLNINNGEMAAVSYYKSVFEGSLDKETTKKELLDYCKLDTEAMMIIVNKLKTLVSDSNH